MFFVRQWKLDVCKNVRLQFSYFGTRLHQLFNILICISTLHTQHVLPSCRLPDLMKNRKCTFYLTELDRQTAGPDEERKVYFLSDGGPSDCRTWWRTESVLLIWRRTVRLPDLHDEERKVYFLSDWARPLDCRTWWRTESVLLIWRITVRLPDLMKNRKCTSYLMDERQTAGHDEERKVHFLSDGWTSDCRTWWRTESVLLICLNCINNPLNIVK